MEPTISRIRVVSEDGQHFTVVQYHEVVKDETGNLKYGDLRHYETSAGHEVNMLRADTYEIVPLRLIVRNVNADTPK